MMGLENASILENNPKVSIIIPVYNGAKYIKDALVSVFQQSYQNIDLVIVNDGSHDSTIDTIHEFQEKSQIENNITILSHQRNKGVSYALNTGLEAADGKYIAILDHDDKRLHQDKIKKQVNFLEENTMYGMVGTNTLIDIGGDIIKSQYPIEDEEIRQTILGKCPMSHSAIMYHKSIALAIGGYNNNYKCAIDYDMFLRILKESKGYNLEDNMTYYRIHNGNISANRNQEQRINALMLSRQNRNNFPNKTKALICRTGSVLVSTLLPNTDVYKKVQLFIKKKY